MARTVAALASRTPVRIAFSILALAACFLVIWLSARAGFSRLLARYAVVSDSLAAADAAVKLTPDDPEAHRARSAVLRFDGRLEEAAKESELAISLRPQDDLLWLELGSNRDALDDNEGSLAALTESVRRAPYYAHPRWQRGNVLLRMGRYDEAFADLRQAAQSDVDFVPSLIDLAWGISRSDAGLTEQLAGINTPAMHLAFARFLAARGKGPEALQQFRTAGSASDQIRLALVRQLTGNKLFREAFEIWASGMNAPLKPPAVYDGGFEGTLSLDEEAFGWRLIKGQAAVSLSVDSTQKQSGEKSLRIQFNGEASPGLPLVAQWIIVEPSHRYRVSFAARTQELVTGGLPIVTAQDAATRQDLAHSDPIRATGSDWQVMSFEFTPNATTNAVELSLRRENCPTSPCPIFGYVWLDSFSVAQLN